MHIPVGYAQINLIFTGPAVPRGAQLTFGVDNTTGAHDADTLAGIAENAWDVHLQPVTLDTVTLASVRAKKGPNSTGQDATVSSNKAGLQSATAESPQVAIVVTKRTDVGGRKGKGRWFLPGVRESYVSDGGLVDSAGGTAIGLALTSFLAALASAGTPMVLLHNDPADTPTPVVAMEVTNRTGTQRRRLRKVGGRRSTPTP